MLCCVGDVVGQSIRTFLEGFNGEQMAVFSVVGLWTASLASEERGVDVFSAGKLLGFCTGGVSHLLFYPAASCSADRRGLTMATSEVKLREYYLWPLC